MNPILTPNSFSPFPNGPFASSRSDTAEQTKAGSLSQTLDTDLTITTAEGDTVTINLASALTIKAGTYSRQAVENGQRTSTQTAYLAYSDSQDMTIAVDGDLNAEELADIREAMAAIGGMIEDFLAGDLQEMAKDGELFKRWTPSPGSMRPSPTNGRRPMVRRSKYPSAPRPKRAATTATAPPTAACIS